MPAPQIFRVTLKKHTVKFSSKAIYVKILKAFFFFGEHARIQITEARQNRIAKPHAFQRGGLQRYRVVKKIPVE